MMQDQSSEKDARIAHILWQRRFAFSLSSYACVLANGLVVLEEHPDGTRLHRVGVSDGQSQWSTSLNWRLRFPLTRIGRHLYTACPEGNLAQIALTNGAHRRPQIAGVTGHFAGPCVSKHGRMFLRVNQGAKSELVALEESTMSLAWRVPDPSDGARDIRIVTALDRLIVAWSHDGIVHLAAISTENGTTHWHTTQLEGTCLQLWALCKRIDVVTLGEGIVGIDFETGKVRNRRYRPLQFTDAMIAGEHLLVSLQDDEGPFLRATHTLIGPPLGEVREGFKHLIGADCSAALIEHTDGFPEMFSLPHLGPIRLSDVKLVGPTAQAFWARDTAYLLGKDGHTLTGIDRVHATV